MKKTFFRMLPFVTAVVLVASCGKDGDSDVAITIATPAPVETVSDNGFIEIPFSIKVNDGKSLSKVALDGTTKSINFETDDVSSVMLTVSGATVDGISGTLDLSQDGDNYSFSGKITVPEEQKDAFTTGEGIDLVGTFTQDKGDATTNATSFADLWSHCAHTYKAEFKSNDENLTLYDQNFYIYVTTYKEAISIDGKTVTSDNFAKGSYYVFPFGTTTVTGLPEGKAIAPSKLYTIGKPVQSVTINNVPTATKYWGNEVFYITASVSPSDATNPKVAWTLVQGNAELTTSGDNNSTCSVFIKGNTEDVQIIATVDGVDSDPVTITVDKEYVDLGTGRVYWKMDNSESGSGAFINWASRYPAKSDFSNLLEKCTYSKVDDNTGRMTNKNGSDAHIDLAFNWYWSTTTYYTNNAYCLQFEKNDRDVVNQNQKLIMNRCIIRVQ